MQVHCWTIGSMVGMSLACLRNQTKGRQQLSNVSRLKVRQMAENLPKALKTMQCFISLNTGSSLGGFKQISKRSWWLCFEGT